MAENEAVLNQMKQYRDYAVNELNMCGEMKHDDFPWMYKDEQTLKQIGE